jgi:hypothetical protein
MDGGKASPDGSSWSGVGRGLRLSEPPGEQPSTAEVERSRRADVEHERHQRHQLFLRRRPRGRLSGLSCRETTHGVWFCTLRFDNGLIVVERVAWYQNADSEGISMVSERSAR